jgi:hypothetical protein
MAVGAAHPAIRYRESAGSSGNIGTEVVVRALAIPSFFEIKESGEVRNRSEKNRI